MEPWPSFIFMLGTRTYLSKHCVTSSRAFKGPLRCRRWTFVAEGGPLYLPKSLVIMLAMPNFLILFVQQCIIVRCSHPHPLQQDRLNTLVWMLTCKHAHASDPLVHADEKTEVPCQASFRSLPLALKFCFFMNLIPATRFLCLLRNFQH